MRKQLPDDDLSAGVKVARGATYLFAQGLLSAALGVIYIVLLTRLLRPEEIGTFGVLSFALGLIQTIGLLSLSTASVKYIAQFMAESNRDRAKAVVTRILQVTMVASTMAFVLVLILSGWISDVLSTPSIVVQASVVQVLAVSAFFVLFFYQAIGFLQGLQKLRDMAIVNILYTIVQYGLALVLVYLEYGVLGIMISWAVAFVICTALALIMTQRNLGLLGKPAETKPLLKFAFPLYVSSILSFLVVWIDQLFVLPYTDLAVFAKYNIANRAAVVPALISSALIAALYPKLSELYAESGKSSVENAFTVTTRYAVFVGFPIILLVAVLAYPIIVLFAGASYAPAAFPLALLCVSILFGTLGVAIVPTFFTMERTWIAALTTFVAVVADAVFSYVLIAFLGLGMEGAATAKIISAAVGFVFGVVLLRQYIKVKFDNEMLWKVSLASVFMILAILGFDVIRQQLTGPPYTFLAFRLLLLPFYIVLGIIVFFIAIFALHGLKRVDIELLRDYLPRGFKRIATWVERFVPDEKAKGSAS